MSFDISGERMQGICDEVGILPAEVVGGLTNCLARLMVRHGIDTEEVEEILGDQAEGSAAEFWARIIPDA